MHACVSPGVDVLGVQAFICLWTLLMILRCNVCWRGVGLVKAGLLLTGHIHPPLHQPLLAIFMIRALYTIAAIMAGSQTISVSGEGLSWCVQLL